MISVVGIAVSTAALIILLSAFNGIENLVKQLYSDFDPPLTIRSAKGKTFNKNFIPVDKLREDIAITDVINAVEEVVILKHEQKWVHAKMLGVDTNFLTISSMEKHIVDGENKLFENETPLAIFGAYVLDKLDGYIPHEDMPREVITFHVPLREGKIRPGKNPLQTRRVEVAARMNFNKEVNAEYVVVPYSFARDLLNYDEDVSAIYLGVESNANLKEVKKRIQSIVGNDFEVKTNFEKNELIFKTSQTERIIVFFILVFIFILSSFNLIASIIMMYVEKRQDIKTLYSLGATKQLIFKVFFFQGLLINLRGVLAGLFIGYAVVLTQHHIGILEMPGSRGEYFPMLPTWNDAFFILFTVGMLGLIIAYFPSRFLVYRTKNKEVASNV